MTEDNEAEEMMQRCASCGVAEADDTKLMDCSACHLAKYCSVKCQKYHWPQHKRACKKRAAELHDEILFKQPESNHWGDCPICCVPLPVGLQKSTLYSCCSKQICIGCQHANRKRDIEGRLEQKCPFCRKTLPGTDEETNEQMMKRVEANDPVALRDKGTERYHEGNYEAAVKYWSKAASLGDAEAHYQLSCFYRDGLGVEKDEKKELYHLEQAAIKGHPNARHNLAIFEVRNDRMNRAVKHFIIAANLGYDTSLENVRLLHEAGYASKEDFAAALRGHKAAVDATKSSQREEAAEFLRKRQRT